MSVQDAQDELNKQFLKSCAFNDGFSPMEADDSLNNESRWLINRCHQEWPEVWLIKVNVYPKDEHKDENQVVYYRITPGEMVYNFAADKAVPCFDQKLYDALKFRANPPQKGYCPKHNYNSLVAIDERVEELKGVTLVWS